MEPTAMILGKFLGLIIENRDSGRSRQSLVLLWFLVTGRCRRRFNLVIFRPIELASSRSTKGVGFLG
jgi:hypothetical protein